MEKEKNSTGYTLLVGILCLVIGLLGGYIITDKVLKKECVNTTTENTSNNENTTNNESTIVNPMINLNKLEKYKNPNDDSYGGIKYFYDRDFYKLSVFLNAEGKVYILHDVDNKKQYITNLENIVDFVEMVNPYNDTIYFLSAEGNVYSYELSNYQENIFVATKENMSNVVRIMLLTYNDGHILEPGRVLIGVTKDGKTVILNEQ